LKKIEKKVINKKKLLIFSSIIGEERLTVEKRKNSKIFLPKKKNRNIKNEIKRTVCFVAMAKVDDVIDG
jgi:hypothetical protein